MKFLYSLVLHVCFLIQITQHWSYNLKPKMTLDKLQFIETVVVLASFKVRWFSWWNSSALSKEALHFSAKPISDKDLEAWLSKASFYARVTFYVHSFQFKSMYI
jgi:hypothetical protein